MPGLVKSVLQGSRTLANLVPIVECQYQQPTVFIYEQTLITLSF